MNGRCIHYTKADAERVGRAIEAAKSDSTKQ